MKNHHHVEKSLADLTDSMYTTCKYLDQLGNAATTKFDCCISETGTASDHSLRDKYVCLGRTAAAAFGITASDTCGKCPTAVGLKQP